MTTSILALRRRCSPVLTNTSTIVTQCSTMSTLMVNIQVQLGNTVIPMTRLHLKLRNRCCNIDHRRQWLREINKCMLPSHRYHLFHLSINISLVKDQVIWQMLVYELWTTIKKVNRFTNKLHKWTIRYKSKDLRVNRTSH